MAVAGRDCTIIARSGHFATVTPFSVDLPAMERVKIGDVAIAYDNPFSEGDVSACSEEFVVDSADGSQPTPAVFDPRGFALPGQNAQVPVN
jgi:hypothetical protein